VLFGVQVAAKAQPLCPRGRVPRLPR